jgi:hypothetical protein
MGATEPLDCQEAQAVEELEEIALVYFATNPTYPSTHPPSSAQVALAMGGLGESMIYKQDRRSPNQTKMAKTESLRYHKGVTRLH